MDATELFKIVIAWIITSAPRIFDVLTKGLDTTKKATDAIEAGQKLLPIIHRGEHEPETGNEPDITPDQASERVYALAALMRSYAIFGFLEFALMVVRLLAIYLMYAKWLEWMSLRIRDKESKKPRSLADVGLLTQKQGSGDRY